MTTRETRHELYQALNAHTSNLEIIRSITSGRNLEALDRRIDAARLLLEWLEQALELERPASRAIQEPPSSPMLQASRLWISHSGDMPIDLGV